jgi:DNA-binding HxlR family transcriptional regulator
MVLKKFTWPAELTLNLIGGKWKGLILNHLLSGESKRFGELKRLSTGISAKILAKHLKELEYDGLITRMVVGSDKPRIVYAPTSRSRSLEPILSAIRQWGSEHLDAYGTPEAEAEQGIADGLKAEVKAAPVPTEYAIETPAKPIAAGASPASGWAFKEEPGPRASSSHSVA